MKINHYLDRSWFNGLRYTLHIMKIIIILLVLGIGNSFSMTYSQNTLLSLDINKQSIKEVIGIIEKKSEYVFFFSDNVRQDLEKSVDIKVNSKTLDVILNFSPIQTWYIRLTIVRYQLQSRKKQDLHILHRNNRQRQLQEQLSITQKNL